MSPTTRALIRTIPERCRTCYTCMRECPAKAIRIMRGQAEVLPERCVGCGNCVLVCRQQAKQIAGSLGAVRDLLASGEPVGLLMAPSFPAEFGSEHSARLLTRLRRLGFAGIREVAFGADLVARACWSACPATAASWARASARRPRSSGGVRRWAGTPGSAWRPSTPRRTASPWWPARKSRSNAATGATISARRSRVVLQVTDLGQLLRHAFKALRVPEMISLQIETDSAPQAEVDPDQLVQVITNLVNNAVEAMPTGGRLQVGVRAKGDEAVLWVRDSGTGIPEALLERIFEPLFTTKQIGKGTGLGLAVTYVIVKMHRGRIEVDTNTDAARGPVGTEFRVILPCRRGEDGAGSLEGLRPESMEE